jgi:hypothetical protein
LSGSIIDQQLVFEQQRLCGDGTYTTWAEKLYEGDEQVDGKDEEFAHETNDTMPAVVRQTARHRRLASYYEFATHSFNTLRTVRSQSKNHLLKGCERILGDQQAQFLWPPLIDIGLGAASLGMALRLSSQQTARHAIVSVSPHWFCDHDVSDNRSERAAFVLYRQRC